MLELHSPLACVWEITNRCNFHCPHCRAFEADPQEDAAREDRILSELLESHVLSVNISGGEPLLHPNVLSIVKRLSSTGVDVGISTNGFLYDEETAVRLKDAGISFVQVSLDGPPQIHDDFRGVEGAYDRAVKAMQRAKNLGHFVQMNTTITAKNVSVAFDNICVAEELGVDRLLFRRVVSAGMAAQNSTVLPSRDAYFALVKRILNAKNEGGSSVHISIDDPIVAVLDSTQTNRNRIFCSAGITSLGIDSGGNVFPCIFARENIGNLCTESLQHIWLNAPSLQSLRKREIAGCGDCTYKFSCGGCRGAAGVFEFDPMCPLSKGRSENEIV